MENDMKYIEQYMEEELKIKALGKIDFEELGDVCDGGKFGYAVLIDEKDIGLQIWWSDYADWLEKKIDIMGGLTINKQA